MSTLSVGFGFDSLHRLSIPDDNWTADDSVSECRCACCIGRLDIFEFVQIMYTSSQLSLKTQYIQFISEITICYRYSLFCVLQRNGEEVEEHDIQVHADF